MNEPPIIQTMDQFVKVNGRAPTTDEIRQMIDFRQQFPIGRMLDGLEWLGEQLNRRAQQQAKK